MFDILGLPDCEEADREEHGPVAHVSVHDAEEEGEGHDREEGRVGLPVVGQAVCVHQLLEDGCELVRPDVRRGALAWRCSVGDEHGGVLACLRHGAAEQTLDLLLLGLRIPAIRAQVHVSLEEVQRRVDRLLLLAEEPPILDERVAAQPQGCQQRRGLAQNEALVRAEEPLLVLHLHLQRRQHLLRGLPVGRPPVRVHAV
mmetsp:Transcript_23916/g.60883  ORF Transcript_23916/g.60883 Transcript_23916/m.60883 type:complete len:200 (-) Transcript_23916:263-862(-)